MKTNMEKKLKSNITDTDFLANVKIWSSIASNNSRCRVNDTNTPHIFQSSVNLIFSIRSLMLFNHPFAAALFLCFLYLFSVVCPCITISAWSRVSWYQVKLPNYFFFYFLATDQKSPRFTVWWTIYAFSTFIS